MKTYVTYNAGCNIWEVEPFDSKMDFHKNEFSGTKKECEEEAHRQMNEVGQPHYPNAPHGSIFDY